MDSNSMVMYIFDQYQWPKLVQIWEDLSENKAPTNSMVDKHDFPLWNDYLLGLYPSFLDKTNRIFSFFPAVAQVIAALVNLTAEADGREAPEQWILTNKY